ncbi:MAG: formylmethanofuran--tetrahydromethanopterin N-formyltransferase [Euryarchaeota archaeon]|nr:formylmethanofuran--tetrahydromethanopterin N-formyltransferase [Euryarchaeota archaeon]
MKMNGVEIEDTYAEAFNTWVARILVTAVTERWARIGAEIAVGFGTTMIGCPGECGVERNVSSNETPDSRPGTISQITGPKKMMKDYLLLRIGQCLIPTPTASVWDALPDPQEKLDVGYRLRFFGDGFESQDNLFERKVIRIPIMSGDFIVEHSFGIRKGVAGGNFLILGETQKSALIAAEAAAGAITKVKGVITPFPGGICASGSKVGSKYKFLRASTNHLFCPTIKDKVPESKIPANVKSVFEIVIDGISEENVRVAMREGISAAVKVSGIVKISAGNYGGSLGPIHIRLHELFK